MEKEKEEIFAPAKEQYDDGAFSFYQWQVDNKERGFADSARIALGHWDSSVYDCLGNRVYSRDYAIHTHRGDEHDATSIPNIYYALDYLSKCNEIRKSEGLAEFRIGNRGMSLSQLCANCVRDEYKHWNLNENIAMGFQPPFDAYNLWYTQEKEFYLANKDAIDAGEMTDQKNKYGHYLNIIKDYASTTGFGVTQRELVEGQPASDRVWIFEQSFDGHYALPTEDDWFWGIEEEVELATKNYYEEYVVSLEEYRALLDEYIDSFGYNEKKDAYDKAVEAREKAEKEYEDAKQSYEEAEAYYQELVTASETATADREKKEKANQDAVAELTLARQKEEALKNEIDALVDVFEAGQKACEDAEAEYTNQSGVAEQAKRAHQDAVSLQESIRQELAEATEAREKAEADIEAVNNNSGAVTTHLTFSTYMAYKNVDEVVTWEEFVYDREPSAKDVFRCSICDEVRYL